MHIALLLNALAWTASALRFAPSIADAQHRSATPPRTRSNLSPKPVSAKLNRRAATLPPKVKSVVALGNVTDPGLDRDSCGSCRVGGRLLWTCRDTLIWNQASQSDQLPLNYDTAGWTAWSASTGPTLTPPSQATIGVASNGTNTIVQMTGNTYSNVQPFYPAATDMCPSNGVCSDGTRWVYWPNSPPLVTTNQTAASRSAVAYAWIDKKHLSGLTILNPAPPYTLFKLTWTGQTGFPTVSVVNDTFWQASEIGFGNYGGIIRNGYAYLYGLNNASQPLLARVPIGSIETRSAYQYYCNGAYSSTVPSYYSSSCVINNAGLGGQGTYYFSSYFGQYLWIGQPGPDINADYYLVYASQPEGPWSNYQLLFQGQNANGSFLGAYSLQAHPGMLPSINAAESYIYLSHTVPLSSAQSYQGSYWTPLYNLTWA